MVNTGKPSAACNACRKRRLKCDQTKPACIKCIKAKRPCPGYREPFTVDFRDQTEFTIRKHAKSLPKRRSRTGNGVGAGRFGGGEDGVISKGDNESRPTGRRRKSVGGSSSSGSSAASTADSTVEFSVASSAASTKSRSSSIGNSFLLESTYIMPEFGQAMSRASTPPALEPIYLGPAVEYQGLCFFMSNFIRVQGASGGASFLDPVVCVSAEGSPFHTALVATSLAALATRSHAQAGRATARSYYNRALRQVARLMNDCEQSKEDSTLATIIMLIMYEALMWEDTSPQVLRLHITGAQAIIKQRGPEGRAYPLGRAMLEYMRALIVYQLSHSQTGKYTEADMEWWTAEGMTELPLHRLQRLNGEVNLLRRQLSRFLAAGKAPSVVADSSHGFPSSAESSAALRMYRRARQLDAEFEHSFQEPGFACEKQLARWQPAVAEDELDRTAAFPGIVYDFASIWTATKHLNAHAARLLLADVMCTVIDWMRDQHDPGIMLTERDATEAMARAQVADIVAIAPYFCTWPREDCPSPYAAMVSGFQLAVTASSRFLSDQQRTFLLGRLAALADTSGMRLVGMLARPLRAGLGDTPAVSGSISRWPTPGLYKEDVYV